MAIKKLQGIITKISPLSETAKEVTIVLSEPLGFTAGAFVNIFMPISGQKIRRAYSISSSDKDQRVITISVRRTVNGVVSPHFWDTNIINTTVDILGPLGLNTVDKMNRSRVFLFAFGIGAGVVKSIADHLSHRENVSSITILTGSRHTADIIHKDYFDQLTTTVPFVTVTYITSDPKDISPYKKRYIQDHIYTYDFSHSDIYICGQEIACQTLVAEIKKKEPIDCDFFVEGFH
jgi:ring-1,2-phenylacetyl-CoA epoxidase subunit PaaE